MKRLVLFNKPYEVMCQFTDVEGRATLAGYIPIKDVYAAGRLDFDSEGLLVLTNAGWLQHLITNPNHELAKTYLAQVEGVLSKQAIDGLARGVMLKDGVTRPAAVEMIDPPEIWPRVPPIRYRKSVPTSWLRITITEGRNRQVRRMTAAVGNPTLRLIRESIGPWNLSGLQPGQWQEIQCPRDRAELLKMQRK